LPLAVDPDVLKIAGLAVMQAVGQAVGQAVEQVVGR